MNSVNEISGLYSTKTVAKISAKERRNIQKVLYELSRNKHISLPIAEVEAVLNLNGFHLIQEDGTPFSGWFCGREGSCHLQFANEEGNVPKSLIAFQWYIHESNTFTKKYEVNLYLS